MSNHPTLPSDTSKPTKKEQIIKLLQQGLGPSEIEARLDTTDQYVYKVICNLRKDGKEITFERNRKRRIDLPSGRSEVSTKEKVRFQVEHNSLLDLPALTQEDLEAIYGYFRAGWKPWDIIHDYGFNPEAIELEYRRFIRMQELDRDHSRKALLDAITQIDVNNTTEEIKQLVKEYKKDGNLSDGDARFLLSSIKFEQRSMGEQNLISKISDSSSELPVVLTGVRCVECGTRISGIAMTKDSGIEQYMRGQRLTCGRHKH